MPSKITTNITTNIPTTNIPTNIPTNITTNIPTTNITTTNITTITTNAADNIKAICPGVDFLLQQNQNATTVLYVNVTDCAQNLPDFTAGTGVVYSACGQLSTFCKMHFKTKPRQRLSVHHRRLQYWCQTRDWKTKLHLPRVFIPIIPAQYECSYHSLTEHVTHIRSRHVYVSHQNNPMVEVDIGVIEGAHFVTRYASTYAGYITVPRTSLLDTLTGELKGRRQGTMILSVQQLFKPIACRSTHKHQLLVKYTATDTGQRFTERVCAGFFTQAKVFFTSRLELTLAFSSHYQNLQLRFSSVLGNQQPEPASGGLFNCSVPHGAIFREHLQCNHRRECQAGEDETEECAFSSGGCQGRVASRNKCFLLLPIAIVSPMPITDHSCRKLGGQLASIKTRKEQEDVLHLLKRYDSFSLTVGYTSGWSAVPFLYSKFRHWLDNTLIYNMDHFKVFQPYRPSGSIRTVRFDAMVFKKEVTRADRGFIGALCEIPSTSAQVIQEQTVRAQTSSSRTPFSSTKQLLVPCLDRRVTAFLVCENNHSCDKSKYSKTCKFGNSSIIQRFRLGTSRITSKLSSGAFICDGDSTGTHVHYTFVCDFRQDCPDNSDESFCEHNSDVCHGFLCSNAQCILHNQRCNDFSDCLDDSDEKDCPQGRTFYPPVRAKSPRHQFYIILDGAGYFHQQTMDDKETCPDTHFQCTGEWLHCLPVYTRCNGFSDCVHGEDEQDCDLATCLYHYQCRESMVCVHGDHLCDGWGQCPLRDDELMCDMTCPEGCVCQGHWFRCSEPFSADLFPHLRYLDGSGSGMSLSDVRRAVYLIHLSLPSCSLSNVSYVKLVNLHFIDLADNQLNHLDTDFFLQLPNLKTVSLAHNPLRTLTNSKWRHVQYVLRRLDVSETCLNLLTDAVSIYLPDLKHVNMSLSDIETIGVKGLKHMPNVLELDLKGNPIRSFPLDLFASSPQVKKVFSSDYRLCCSSLFAKQSAPSCFASSAVLPSCTALMPSKLHTVFFGLVSALAIAGSLGCSLIPWPAGKIFTRDFLRVNAHLHMTSLCMGCHVGITLIVNDVSHGQYLQFEKGWTKSILCRLNVFLSMLSSEVSVFVVLFLTLTHTTVFSVHRDVWKSVRTPAACAALWFAGTVLSLVPLLPGLDHWGLSDQSGLCRLALFQHHDSTRRFRWFQVVVAVNVTTCLLTVTGQIIIRRRSPRNSITLDSATRLHYCATILMRRLSALEATCWFSFGVGMLTGVQAGDRMMQGTLAVFVLPLPAALRPLLYLWTLLTQQLKSRREARILSVLKSRLVQSARKATVPVANK